MRAFSNSLVMITLASFAALGLTVPALSDEPSPLAARSQFCYNAPTTVAGTYLDRRSLIARDSVPYRQPSLNKYPQYWCAPGCETYISVTYISNIPSQTWSVVQNVLSGAIAQTLSQVRAVGDGVVGGSGQFSYRASGLEVFTSNSNNHQQTWGVLSAALVALADYFTEIQQNISALPGSVTFVIYDGENEVATGGFGTG